MNNVFPSITGLRAFEAAARHRSFTRAAIELNLTQSAVSHQIRKLEDILGAPLFDRVGNDIQLTEIGTVYNGVARAIITELRLATDRAMRRGQSDVLTIGALGTFAVKCLIPRLHDFIARNPDISLRLKILPASQEARFEDCDVAVLYGRETDWPGFVATRLSTDELFPVCSPGLASGPIGITEPRDLAKHIIIRTISPLILRDDWPFWLRRAGVKDVTFTREIACDLLYPSYQLAVDGVGIALGRSAVVRGDIAAGRLIEPFSVRIKSTLGYFAVHPPQLSASKVERFVEWASDMLQGDVDDEQDPGEDLANERDGIDAGSGSPGAAAWEPGAAAKSDAA